MASLSGKKQQRKGGVTVTYDEINIGDILIANPFDKTYRYKVTRKNDRSHRVTVHTVEEYDANLQRHVPCIGGVYTVLPENFCRKIQKRAVVL